MVILPFALQHKRHSQSHLTLCFTTQETLSESSYPLLYNTTDTLRVVLPFALQHNRHSQGHLTLCFTTQPTLSEESYPFLYNTTDTFRVILLFALQHNKHCQIHLTLYFTLEQTLRVFLPFALQHKFGKQRLSESSYPLLYNASFIQKFNPS